MATLRPISDAYSEAEVDALLTQKSNADHTHSDLYTESEVDGLLTAKADAVHTHTNLASEELGCTVDGGGSVLTAGVKGYRRVTTAGTITAATLLADTTGSVAFSIKKSTYANFPTTAEIGTIALSSAQKNTDSTLTGWTTSVSAGDVLEFTIIGTPATITRATVTLTITH